MNNPLMQQPMPQNQPNNPIGGGSLPAGFPLDDAILHNEKMADRISKLLGNPQVSAKDVLQSLVDAANEKSLTFQQAAQLATQMPTDDQLKPWLTQHLMQNIQIGKMLAMHQGGQNAR
jgi:hypothetical protein